MSTFTDIVERVRKGESIGHDEIKAACERPEQLDFLIIEQTRPPFLRSMTAPSEEEQIEADAEKNEINSENGYDVDGNVIEPIPDELK